MALTVHDVFEGISKKDYSCFDDWNDKHGVDGYTRSGGTLLTWAITTTHNIEIIVFLLQKGADVNQREKQGATPLMLAIHLNRLDVVKCLINNKVDVKEKDSYDTPLTAAVKEGNLQMVELLLDSNADATQRDLKRVPPLIRAIRDNKLEIVDLFLKNKKGLNVVDAQKNTPLIAAIVFCESRFEILHCLLKNKVNADESINDNTPLGWAARKGDLEAVKLLLTYGADINLINSSGNTPLATAVQWRQPEVAKYLVDNNANVCKHGKCGKTPLLWAVQNEDIDMMNLLLDNGAQYIIHKIFLDVIETKNLKIVQCLVERKLTNQTKWRQNTETTSLEKAVKVGSVEIAKYFIENNADVVEDLHQREISQILELLLEGKTEMVKLLTENGARINELGDCGDTVLTKSIDVGNFDMVKYFVAQGADVNRANQKGLTPLAIAESNDNFKIFQYLVECGASISEEEQEENPNVVMYYHMAKENIERQKPSGDIQVSNQESA